MQDLSIEQAKKIAERYLAHVGSSINISLMIVEGETKEIANCFIFSYNSREFIEEGNISAALVANPPLFVDRRNGKIYQSGTAYPIEYYIERFQKGDMEIFSEVTFA